jgi:hypothetical protein
LYLVGVRHFLFLCYSLHGRQVCEISLTPEFHQPLDSLRSSLICPCIHVLWRGAIVLGFGLLWLVPIHLSPGGAKFVFRQRLGEN